MPTLGERLDRCNQALKRAVAEAKRLHSEAERAGILIWEMDERHEREAVLIEIATGTQSDWVRL